MWRLVEISANAPEDMAAAHVVCNNKEKDMKTYMANPDTIERKWYVVDAAGKTLGRLASEVAKVLRGKN